MIGSAKSCYSVRATCIQDVPGARVCQHVLGSVRDCQGNAREHLRCIHCIKTRGPSMIFCMCL